jgi:hypothetical protein
VHGSGFNQEGACNKTVRFATFEIKPIHETEDNLITVLSPQVKVADEVVVAVALNGQQFNKDIVLHKRDYENTFSYTNYYYGEMNFPEEVRSGEVIEFDPPIEDLGVDADGKRKKIKLRIVDPDTLEPLAEPYEIDPDDLTPDGKLKFQLPNRPPLSKGLVQITYDDDDWHDYP